MKSGDLIVLVLTSDDVVKVRIRCANCDHAHVEDIPKELYISDLTMGFICGNCSTKITLHHGKLRLFKPGEMPKGTWTQTQGNA